ncbi:MAG TPA: RHS repeat-associated core domain-containing protein, partial [Longimicrobium sp.]|nr:RHS repeat-associated core domain-containing protein [Longimicrobium sp.]
TIEPGTGRLKRRMTPRFAFDSLYAGDTIQYYYNWRGERTGVNDRSRPERNPNYNPFDPNQPEWLQRIEESISMYRSDGLMYEFRRLSTLQLGAQPRLKERYAYDALGRRVWRRARAGYSLGDTLARDSICNRTVPSSECASVVERTIWDGDQVIADFRETIEYTPRWEHHYGRAIYAHAGGIDQPTEVVRLDGNADFVVIPHRNWQGSVDMVTFTGAKYTQCGPHNWQSWRNSCYPVELPIRSSYGEPPRNDYNAPDPGPASWMGSLMEGSRDFSGLMYRRNRYLDPASGQFTQVDPIGLAGGLNLYGFANGDPVSYSDPYGLCPVVRDGVVIPCAVIGGLIGTGAGAVGGAVVGAGGGTLVAPGVGTVAGGVGGAELGGFIGGGIGATIGGALDVAGVAGDQLREQATAAREGIGRGIRWLTTLASVNQMNREIQRGQAPDGVDRVDKSHGKGGQDHVHFGNNAALNRDGTWKEGSHTITRQQRAWLTEHGWNVPQ